jgi:asparagine synthase (glutamine-hydrolysing)
VRALELVVLDALRRPPCLVSFSGGRDSSAVLAVATRVARREGLELPVPSTFRYPQAPGSEESEWQEMVVRSLGLTEWDRREIGTEIDLLGPVARRVLRRHGVLYHANTHIQALRFEGAAGATLISGNGGDHVLGGWPWGRLWAVLGARCRPRPGDARLVARALAPRTVRARRAGRHAPTSELEWLRAGARAALAEAWAAARASEPLRWDEHVVSVARRRDLWLLTEPVAAIAREAGVDARNPLLDHRFLGALAVHGGRAGFASRTAAMEALFADVLPAPVVARRSKAHFAAALWGPDARAFAERWNGEGIPDELVDAEALRREWDRPTPRFESAMLLQAAWLASAARGDGQHAVDDLVE